MNFQSTNNQRVLTVFSLMMITVGSVDSIRNLPATALFGTSLIFFFIIAAMFFLIPCALVSAELASAWAKQGGIYIWVKEAFGIQMGFVAIWLQWIENVVWYPTILSFVAGTIGYIISPTLVTDKLFLVSVILCAFWGTTIINLLGMKSSAWFSSLCSIVGLLVPMGLIIILGIIWILTGKASQISFTPHAMLPNFNDPSLWISLTGIMMSFCGIEIATVHARDVKNPQHAFPRALFFSTLMIVGTLLFGALAIAMVVPNKDISLVAGNMQAFNVFFNAYHMNWVLPLIALFLVLGGLGSVSNWIIAPTKGLLVAAQDGNMPRVLQKENKLGAPSTILICQAIVVSILSMVFLLMPSVNSSYWLLTALASQLYMLMYILMFAAGIYLRFKCPNQERPYKIPGGKKIGMLLVGGCGIFSCIITIIVGFFPPSGIKVGGILHYETLLILGLLIMCLPPFIAYRLRRPHWQQK
jgi:amino acid transporter